MISLIENKKTKGLYSLSEHQVSAILELRLQKLTAFGISEIETEINKLANLIINLNKNTFHQNYHPKGHRYYSSQ